MRSISCTDLRNNAKACFDAVEAGETIEVVRHGRPIAQIRPIRTGPHARWVNRPKPIRLKAGASLTNAVLAERRESKR
jgi:prevent-host-death family protein